MDIIKGINGFRYDVLVQNTGMASGDFLVVSGVIYQPTNTKIVLSFPTQYSLSPGQTATQEFIELSGDIVLDGRLKNGAYSLWAEVYNASNAVLLDQKIFPNKFNIIGIEVANGGFETGNFHPEWDWEENIRGEDDVEPIITREILSFGHSGNYSCSFTVKPENTNPEYALWASVYLYNKQVSIGTSDTVDFFIWIDLRTQMVDGEDVLTKMYTWVCEYDASNNLLSRTQTKEITPSDLEWLVYTKFSETYTIQNPNCHHLGYGIEIVTKDTYGFEIRIDDLGVV